MAFNSSTSFGTTSAEAALFTQPSYFADVADPSTIVVASATGSHDSDMDHAQIPVMFKNLVRRDAKTKERAVNELYALLKKIYIISPSPSSTSSTTSESSLPSEKEKSTKKQSPSPVDQKELYSVLLCWSQLYPKLALDLSNRIRSVSHKIQSLLFAKAFSVFPPPSSISSSSDLAKAKNKHKAILKLVGLVAGTWYSGIFDSDRLVASECKAGFETVFPSIPATTTTASSTPTSKTDSADKPSDKSKIKPKPSKQDAFFIAFENNILAYISDILISESYDTLSDTRYVPADESWLKYQRAQRACVLALSNLIDHKRKALASLPKPGHRSTDASVALFDESSDTYTTFLDVISAKGFWKLTSSDNGLLSRAALTSISKIIAAIPLYVLEEHTKEIFNAFIKTPLAKKESSKSGAQTYTQGFSDVEVIQALAQVTKYFPQVWSYKSRSDEKKKEKKDKKKKNDDGSKEQVDDSVKKEKKDKSALAYLANFLKVGNSQNSPVFWHVVMGLLITIPEPHSPFPTTYTDFEDKTLFLEPAKLITEAVAEAAKNANFTKPLADATPAQRPAGSKASLNNAADTWTFYLALVEKIADQEKENEATSELVSTALSNFSDYLYGKDSLATAVAPISAMSSEDTSALARQKANHKASIKELDSTISVIATRVAEHLWLKYPAESLSELDKGFNSVYDALDENSATPIHLQAALTNAVKFGYNILSSLSKQSAKEQATVVSELLNIFINKLVGFYGMAVSLGFTDSTTFDKLASRGPAVSLIISLYGSDSTLKVLSDDQLVLKFKQLCTVYFSTISSTNPALPKHIYETFSSVVYNILKLAKANSSLNEEFNEAYGSKQDHGISFDTNQFVLLGVEKVLAQRPPIEDLVLDNEKLNTNNFFPTLSKFLLFSNVLSSKPLLDSPKLSNFIADSLVSWINAVSPSQKSADLHQISDEAAKSILYSIIYHSAIVENSDALKIFTVLVDKVISLEKQYLSGEFDVVTKEDDKSVNLESRAVKIKNSFKWIISQVKANDSQFILTYTSSEDGKAALKELWNLAGEQQQNQGESADKESSFIDSIITHLDLFSSHGESVVASETPLSAEVVLKIVKELKQDVMKSSLFDLDMYIQQALNILSKLDSKQLGTPEERSLKLEAFQNLLFDKNTWDSVLQKIFNYGIPKKTCLSENKDSRSSAFFLLDSKAVSKAYGERYVNHMSQEFVQGCTQLLNICMYTATVSLQFPFIFDQSGSESVYNVVYGLSYANAIFDLLSECGVLQNLTNSQYFASLNEKDSEDERNTQLSDINNSTRNKQTLDIFMEVSKAVQRDALALLSQRNTELQVDSQKTLDIIEFAVNSKDASVSIANSVELGADRPYHNFFAQVWESSRDVSTARSFYSYIVLEQLLNSFFSTKSGAKSSIPAAANLKKYIPSRILNKFGVLAMLSSLSHVAPKSNVIAEGLSSFRNNLLADIIAGPRTSLHTDKRAIFALAALTPALYHSGETKHGVVFPDSKSSELVGISPFKIANFVARVASTFDNFLEPECAPFAILLSRVLTAFSSTYLPQDMPSSTFWEPIIEYVNSIVTASSSLTQFDDDDDSEQDVNQDDEDGENKWFASAYLNSGLHVLNTFMVFYNYDVIDGEEGFDNAHLETEEIDESLRSIHSLLTDTITVFYDSNSSDKLSNLDYSLSSKILDYYSESIKPNNPGALPYYESDKTLFYSLLANNDPFIQQTAMIVICDELRMHQKDRALEYAAISAPTADEIEQQLIPMELFSLILSPPAEFNSSKSKSDSVLDTLVTAKARQYFYTWYIIFQYFELSVYSLRILFLNQLKERESISELLNCISAYFFFLKSDFDKSTDITKIDPRSKFYVADSVVSLDTVKQNVDALKPLLWNLIFQSLNYAGPAVKNWFNGSINLHLRAEFKTFVAKYISPLLIQSELTNVRKYAAQEAANYSDNDDDDDIGVTGVKRTEINITNSGRLIVVRFHVDTQYMELEFHVPDGYPLQDIRIEGTKRVGANERQWGSWISLSQATLFKRLSGSVVTAIELFKRNATMYFEGFTECSICYSVLQDDKSLPTKECHTCHNKFHASCLQKWFKSGGSNSCPLCRTEKAF